MEKVAYILDCFPVYSETFILREILEMQRRGIGVTVLAQTDTTHHPLSLHGKVVHPEAEALRPHVRYQPPLTQETTRLKKLLLHLYFFVRAPRRYLRALKYARSADAMTYRMFKSAPYYAMLLKRLGVTHLHAHYALLSCHYAMMISLVSGIPYSFTVHAHDIFIRGLALRLEDKVRNARFVVCESDYIRRDLLGLCPNADPGRLPVIHGGIDINRYRPVSAANRERLTIVSVGRLVEHKGFRHLVRACALLKGRGLRYVCRIIGDGTQRAELERLIGEADLGDCVELAGAMPQEAVLAALRGADLFVLACTVEENGMRDGIPNALAEAMAMELPVVSTRMSGIPELVKDGAGILVDPEDPEALANAIEDLARLSARERGEIGRCGRVVIEKEFILAVEVEKLASLFSGAAPEGVR
jgi:glycosyltransferase involved in cell wall biosynthesis